VTRMRGFTLIEVLVALAVAAMGLAAVLAVVTNTANAAAGVRERSFAAWIANNRLVEVRISGTFPSVDRTTGDLDYAGLKWKWEQTVTQTDVPGMRRLEVRVRLADAADDAFLATVSGFVGRTQATAPPGGTSWDPPPTQATGAPGTNGTGPGGNTIVAPGITPTSPTIVPRREGPA
jgi:general secretion pathway protein I